MTKCDFVAPVSRKALFAWQKPFVNKLTTTGAAVFSVEKDKYSYYLNGIRGKSFVLFPNKKEKFKMFFSFVVESGGLKIKESDKATKQYSDKNNWLEPNPEVSLGAYPCLPGKDNLNSRPCVLTGFPVLRGRFWINPKENSQNKNKSVICDDYVGGGA